METLLQLSESEAPSTIVEVLQALRGQDLDPRHEAKTWGDWIHIDGFRTVISIESMRGLTRSATIEHGENEESEEPIPSIHRAFSQLGWHGIDEEGEFPLG
jgi:hypothetical protein